VKIAAVVYKAITLSGLAWNRYVVSKMKCASLESVGSNVRIGIGAHAVHWNNISVKDNVSIGRNNLFFCSRAKVYIGDHVMFGPNVTVITGRHRTDMVGRYMITVTDAEKNPDDDREVVFEGDNWIGANATILQGGNNRAWRSNCCWSSCHQVCSGVYNCWWCAGKSDQRSLCCA
jgi:acetyltransferase-like isoleucine patch superfamily enzyme